MKLRQLRISNFQSFGPVETELTLDDLTFLIGPNGSGKTAVLQALCRMFAFDPTLRRIQRSDFHVPATETPETVPDQRLFWIEADFAFPELEQPEGIQATIPPHFAHMRQDDASGSPRVRIRLDAKLDADGEIEDDLTYVLDVDDDSQPLTKHQVHRADRSSICVHYLPARRDPSDHIAYTANSLLGRVLRSANWRTEREAVKDLTDQISTALAGNSAITALGSELAARWESLHKGSFFADPQVTFRRSELEGLLRHLSISFSPGHDMVDMDFSRLSDGQKSILYLSLVLTIQGIGRSVISGESSSFDPEKLKPAVFTLIAMEEPENSLSPHYLGRIAQCLGELGRQADAQALIATQSPQMLRRVPPEAIRYMRLTENRQTLISAITLPPKIDDAHKFVREAVQAFPELYFSRLVVLGEGDSEEIVLPRLLSARGLAPDETAVSVVPLGGRHVHHFWRLLSSLKIPFVTLLDLDLARHQGGWGRIRYVLNQLLAFAPEDCPHDQDQVNSLPLWNDDAHPAPGSERAWLDYLEARGVFFSSPLDLDFSMVESFPAAYEAATINPTESKKRSVLGDHFHGIQHYTESQTQLFATYHKRFKLGSKPAAHLSALSQLDDFDLKVGMPAVFGRMIDVIRARLDELPE